MGSKDSISTGFDYLFGRSHRFRERVDPQHGWF